MPRVPVYRPDPVAPGSVPEQRFRAYDNGGGFWGGVGEGLQTLGGGMARYAQSDDALLDRKRQEDARRAREEEMSRRVAVLGYVRQARDYLSAWGGLDAQEALSKRETVKAGLRAGHDALVEQYPAGELGDRVAALLAPKLAADLDEIDRRSRDHLRAMEERSDAEEEAEVARRAVDSIYDPRAVAHHVLQARNVARRRAIRGNADAGGVAAAEAAAESGLHRRMIDHMLSQSPPDAELAAAYLAANRDVMTSRDVAWSDRVLKVPLDEHRWSLIADEIETIEPDGGEAGGKDDHSVPDVLSRRLAVLAGRTDLNDEDRAGVSALLEGRTARTAVERRQRQGAARGEALDFVDRQGVGGFVSYGQLPPSIRAYLSVEDEEYFRWIARHGGSVPDGTGSDYVASHYHRLAVENREAFVGTDLRRLQGKVNVEALAELTNLQKKMREGPGSPEELANASDTSLREDRDDSDPDRTTPEETIVEADRRTRQAMRLLKKRGMIEDLIENAEKRGLDVSQTNALIRMRALLEGWLVNTRSAASDVYSMMPVIGPGKAIIDAETGRDSLTGEPIDREQAILDIILSSIPGGKVARRIKDKPNDLEISDLGKFLGSGGNKDVYAYRDKWAVGILRSGKKKDSLEREIYTLKELEKLGFPTVQARGPIVVDGRPALIFDRFEQGSKDIVRSKNGKLRVVGGSRLLNEKSVSDLMAIKKLLIEKNIAIEDLQFLIANDGRVVVSDPLSISENRTLLAKNIKMIDILIRESKKR